MAANKIVGAVVTQVAGYQLVCACNSSISAMPAVDYAYAYNKVVLAYSVTAPES
ncbi:MAG: hypothetical protein V7K67_34515 [Nostoc sp.]|uniref:hypothetical protein n=1 Tax=Nostoc sp. TaxID=1180 RepID=UPI002FEF7C51